MIDKLIIIMNNVNWWALLVPCTVLIMVGIAAGIIKIKTKNFLK